jgi:hypothetical protein
VSSQDQIKSTPFCIFEPQYQTNPNYVCTSSQDKKTNPYFALGEKMFKKKCKKEVHKVEEILQLLRANSKIFCLTMRCQITKVWFKGLGVEAYLLLLVCTLI